MDYEFFRSPKISYSKIEDAPGYLFNAIKYYKSFYGPSTEEYDEFRRINKGKFVDLMPYILNILDYWFVQREKLKERSFLHKLVLEREEQKQQFERLKKYMKKYKPNKLKEEGIE